MSDSEHWASRLQSETGLEPPGIDSVEAETIDQLKHCSDCGAVIAGRGHGEAARRSPREPALLELEIAEVIETLHHSGGREPLLDEHARACRRGCDVRLEAVDLFPVVHGVNEDLSGEQVVGEVPKPVHGYRQDDEVCGPDDLFR